MGAWLKNVWLAIKTVGQGMYITLDRKSTRLNSSHDQISYAVFCLKKKKTSNRLTGKVRAVRTQRSGNTKATAWVERVPNHQGRLCGLCTRRLCTGRVDTTDARRV